MNFFQRFRLAFSVKTSQVQTLLALESNARPQTAPRDFEQLAREGYQENVIAYRCINVIAQGVSKLPICLYRDGVDGKREEITKHPLLELDKRPNAMHSGRTFRERYMAFLLTGGEVFVELAGPGITPGTYSSSAPTELWVHRPDRFSVTPGKNGIPSLYTAKVGPNERTFPVTVLGESNVFHHKLFNPLNEWRGMSPLTAAALDIDQTNAANLWNYSLMKRGARPSMALVVKASQYNSGTLSEQQRVLLRHEIDRLYAGAENAGRPMLLDGGIEVEQLSLTPKDVEFPTMKKLSQKDIALVFGVPGQIVGVEDSQKFDNFEQARLMLFEDTIVPWGQAYCDELNQHVLPRFPGSEGLYAAVDEDRVSALAPRRVAVWERVSKADWLTPDEKREATDYPEYEPDQDSPADHILVPTTMVPIEQVFGADAMAAVEDDASDLNDPNATEEDPADAGDAEDDEGDGKSVKMLLNLRTAAAKKRALRTLNRKRTAHEGRMASRTFALFTAEKRTMKNALKNTRSEHEATAIVDQVLQHTRADWLKSFRSNLRAVVNDFGPKLLKEGFEFLETKANKDAESVWDQAVESYIEREAGLKITRIQRTTRKKVLAAIKDELDAYADDPTQGITSLAEAIEETYDGFSKGRAMVIARTETHNAMTHATMEAAKALQIPNLRKEWLSVQDARTRGADPKDSSDHLVMNETAVELHEKFLVPSDDGPDAMDGPGDTSAPADQVIQCRCQLIFNAPEED